MLPIGAVSEKTRVNIETIRYYERIGLVPPPPRSQSGRRLFAQDDIRRLRFIRRARELGFSIEDVRRLIALDAGGGDCDETRELAQKHLAQVQEKLADLRRLRRNLAQLVEACESGGGECPILDALAH